MAEAEATQTTEQKVVEQPSEAKKTTNKAADKAAYWTVGRRKEATARIKMALGKGEITINDKPLEDYADNPLKKSKILAPLAITDRQESFDISVKVAGGGKSAQLDAIAMGIARALLEYDETLRSSLRQNGLLTRDSRMKERKKYGLKRARKAPQFSKR